MARKEAAMVKKIDTKKCRRKRSKPDEEVLASRAELQSCSSDNADSDFPEIENAEQTVEKGSCPPKKKEHTKPNDT